MRMIDADKLAEQVKQEPTDGMYTSEILDIIAQQPTLGSDCENCGKVRTCKHVLGHPGTFTRINCPLWRPKK